MNAVMALLDSKRTSDVKMLRRFHYPKELSDLVKRHEILQAFSECDEHNVRLLRRVKIVVPAMYKAMFNIIKEEEVEY